MSLMYEIMSGLRLRDRNREKFALYNEIQLKLVSYRSFDRVCYCFPSLVSRSSAAAMKGEESLHTALEIYHVEFCFRFFPNVVPNSLLLRRLSPLIYLPRIVF